jgi:hypothetical protein
VIKNKKEIPLPTQWIFDILDEFVYQFIVCSKWRKLVKPDDEDLKKLLATDKLEFWNLE